MKIEKGEQSGLAKKQTRDEMLAEINRDFPNVLLLFKSILKQVIDIVFVVWILYTLKLKRIIALKL